MSSAALLAFDVPPDLIATLPPERTGSGRDDVRLLVARDREHPTIRHHAFGELPQVLSPGDLLVVNTSATLGGAVTGYDDRGAHLVHVSADLGDGRWVVELRAPKNNGPDLERAKGDRIRLPGGFELRLDRSYPENNEAPRLWIAQLSPPESTTAYLARHGRAITYDYVTERLPLATYQTVFAHEPGSAEMPSAARPFTTELVVDAITRGVTVAPILLHCGVSSPDAHEVPSPERFSVRADTARLIDSARSAGRRVVAVGTSTVRAVESAVSADGSVREAAGWTDLVLGPDRPARVVDGLLTGLHMPDASHLLLLEAVAGRDLVTAAYEASVQAGYHWHEFGDVNLFLP